TLVIGSGVIPPTAPSSYATQILGNVSTSFVDSVGIGELSTDGTPVARVGKNVSVTNAGAYPLTSVNVFGQVDGSVSVNAAGTAALFDAFSILPSNNTSDSRIGGNLTVSLGTTSGVNIFGILDGTVTRSIINGNVTLISRSGTDDFFTVDGQTNGS